MKKVKIFSITGDTNSILFFQHGKKYDSFCFDVMTNKYKKRTISIYRKQKNHIVYDSFYNKEVLCNSNKSILIGDIEKYFNKEGIDLTLKFESKIKLGNIEIELDQIIFLSDSIGLNGNFIKKITESNYHSAIGDLDNLSYEFIKKSLNINHVDEFNAKLETVKNNLDIIRNKIDNDIIINSSETVELYKELDTYYGEVKSYIEKIGKEKIKNWLELRKMLYKLINQRDEKKLTIHKILKNYCNLKKDILDFGKKIIKEYKKESFFIIFLILLTILSLVLYFGYLNIWLFILPLITAIGGFFGVIKKLLIPTIMKIILKILFNKFLISQEQQLCGNTKI